MRRSEMCKHDYIMLLLPPSTPYPPYSPAPPPSPITFSYSLFLLLFLLSPYSTFFLVLYYCIGMVDVKNLSELLSQSPDVVDLPGARPIPVISYRYFISYYWYFISYYCEV